MLTDDVKADDDDSVVDCLLSRGKRRLSQRRQTVDYEFALCISRWSESGECIFSHIQ